MTSAGSVSLSRFISIGVVSAGFKLVGTFARSEGVEGVCDGAAERLDGSGGGFA